MNVKTNFKRKSIKIRLFCLLLFYIGVLAFFTYFKSKNNIKWRIKCAFNQTKTFPLGFNLNKIFSCYMFQYRYFITYRDLGGCKILYKTSITDLWVCFCCGFGFILSVKQNNWEGRVAIQFSYRLSSWIS